MSKSFIVTEQLIIIISFVMINQMEKACRNNTIVNGCTISFTMHSVSLVF